jgi:hypothetical protein
LAWYRVIKSINGCQYVYMQTTWREGGKVKTKNRYVGPVTPAGSYSPEPRATEAIAADLEEARVRRDILKDVLRAHPVKFFLKFRGRTDQQEVGGTSFAELNAKALRTGAKGRLLDTYLAEYGFATFEELDAAVEGYFQTVAQLKAAKTTYAKLRKEKSYARAYHRALGMRPNRPGLNVEDFETPPLPVEQPKPTPSPPKPLRPGRAKLDRIRRLKPRPRWAGAASQHRHALVEQARANVLELRRARGRLKKKTRIARLFAIADRLRLKRLEDAKEWHALRYQGAFTRLRLRKRRSRK